MSEWISVENRFPREIEQVLFMVNGVVTQGFYNTEMTENEYDGSMFLGHYWFCENTGDTICEFHDITHWMPLPQPPQGD